MIDSILFSLTIACAIVYAYLRGYRKGTKAEYFRREREELARLRVQEAGKEGER